MKNKISCISIVLFFNLALVFSQNTGSSANTWYKINSKGRFVAKIHAAGEYAEHEVVVHIINQFWSTAEVTYLSEFNYNHKRIKLEWGYTGNGSSRYLTVRVVPVTAVYANSFSFQDISNPSFDYALTAIDASLVTAMTPKNQLFVDEWTSHVGIGTTTPDAKLTVAGNIHAQEVKVTVNAGADFVFNEDYQLPPLEEVAQFIKENKHLPEIDSEKVMQENGLHLAEMNIKLLQKIEELTLYTIEQEKQLESQQIQLKTQANTSQELKDRLLRLEQLLLKTNE